MIKSFTVTNNRDETMTCELAKPSKEGFAVVGIDGLGPTQATVNVTDISSIDGGLFNSSRIGSRNIVISLVYYYDSDYTIEELRHKSYRYFPPKKKVQLVFETTNRLAIIEGYVESNEVAIFSKQEGSQISIICPNPYFYPADIEVNNYNSYAIPAFSFPFSRDLDTETDSKLLMGLLLDYKLTEVMYKGDVDTGLVFRVDFLSDIDNNSTIKITNGTTSIENTIYISKIINIVHAMNSSFNAITSGDSLKFSTVKGDKFVTFMHNNVEYNVLSCITSNGDWLYLIPGVNRIRIDTSDTDANVEISSENRVYFNGI